MPTPAATQQQSRVPYSLLSEGFRYMASPDRNTFRWIAPAVRREFYADWTDCTDMSDAEFEAFVTA